MAWLACFAPLWLTCPPFACLLPCLLQNPLSHLQFRFPDCADEFLLKVSTATHGLLPPPSPPTPRLPRPGVSLYPAECGDMCGRTKRCQPTAMLLKRRRPPPQIPTAPDLSSCWTQGYRLAWESG